MIKKNNCSLLAYNTFGIDAKAKCLVEYDSVDELKEIIATKCPDTPVLHIGGGSNLLFLGNYDGLVLHSRITGISIVSQDLDHVTIRVGAGMVWDDLVAYTLQQGWYDLENLSLIPGEVGASAVQNIGAYGAEAKDTITEVHTVDLTTGEERTFEAAECCYGYRHSIFKTDAYRGRYAVTHVCYRLSKHFTPRLDYGGLSRILAEQGLLDTLTPQTLRQTIIDIRNTKLPDPKVQGNGGSFFMNPVVDRAKYEALAAQFPGMPHYDVDPQHVKIPAGWMIDQCGWKGKAIGPAAVHDKQALVLVNRGGATGQDIVTLCHAVQQDVKNTFGIDIHPEVNFIG